VDQSAEDAFGADPIDLERERDHVRIVIRGAQAHSLALMAAASVVVRDVLEPAENPCKLG